MLEIFGFKLNQGEKKQVQIEPNVKGYTMPATLICGSKSGKTICITAGIHSGEHPAIASTIKIAKEIDPSFVTGNIIIIHCVNTSGFWQDSMNVVPEDNSNLNANYPGKKDGTVGEKIAHFFVTEVFTKIDYLVDMHSGARTEKLTPCLFFPVSTDEDTSKKALAMAMATDIPYLICSRSQKGECGYCASLGVPAILVERGHSGHCKSKWVEDYCRDIRLLLNHVGAFNHVGAYSTKQANKTCEKTIIENAIYLESEFDGLWYPKIDAGKKVKKGDVLGVVQDFFGNEITTYKAQKNGIVFYYTTDLSVHKGEPLVAYG